MKGKTLSKRVIVLATAATMMSSTVAMAQEINKDETVYVILNDNGQVEQRIVSAKIKGEKDLGEFKDKCDLKDVKNVKGNETPNVSGDTLTWNVDGKELYYRGESEKELPISVDIKYELDGKEVKPEEARGKEGNFKITLKVKNNQSKTVKIAGEDRKVYVPFLVASEIVMPNNNFTDVSVSSGKMMDDGNNSDITFIAAPGLKESLKLDDILNVDDMLGLNDEIVIKGKTSDFAVPSIVIMATTEGLDLEKLESTDDLNELRDKLNDLEKGGEDLLSGAEKLSNGQKELNSKYQEFHSGVSTLKDGITTLNNGVGALGSKAPELKVGVDQITGGISQLNGAQNQYVGGVNAYKTGLNAYLEAFQKVQSGTDDLATGAAELGNKQDLLTQGIGMFSGKINEYIAAHSQINDGISESIKGVGDLKKGLEEGAAKAGGFKASTDNLRKQAEELDKISDEIATINPEKSIELKKISGTIKATATGQDAGVDELGGKLGKAITGINKLETGLNGLLLGSKAYMAKGQEVVAGNEGIKEKSAQIREEGTDKLIAGANALSAGAKMYRAEGEKLTDGANKLSENANKIYEAVGRLNTGGTELAKGTGALVTGANTLTNGVKELSNGSNKLYDGSIQVKDGIGKLAEGSSELYDGVSKLKSEGLDKISDKGNTALGDIDGLMDAKDELVKLSEEYGTFSGLSDNMDGKVKFVMRINDSNKAPKEKKEEKVEVKEEAKEEGFFKKIANLFKK